MTRALIVLSLLIVSQVTCAAQAPKDWLSYRSPEGRYSVSLPKEPRLNTTEGLARNGDKIPQYVATCYDGTVLFSITYSDNPSTAACSIDDARNEMVKAVKGTLLDDKPMTVRGGTGRHIVISMRDEKDREYVNLVRFYVIGKRVYVLQMISTKAGASTPVFLEKAQKFFTSFNYEVGSL